MKKPFLAAFALAVIIGCAWLVFPTREPKPETVSFVIGGEVPEALRGIPPAMYAGAPSGTTATLTVTYGDDGRPSYRIQYGEPPESSGGLFVTMETEFN